MATYSFEIKLGIVQEYLLGRESLASLAEKYGVNGKNGKVQVKNKNWVNAYQQFL